MEFSQIVVKRFMSKRQFFSSRWSSPGYRRLQSVGTYGNKRVSQCPKNLRNWQKFEFQLIQCDKYIQHMFHACWKDEYFLDLKTCYNMKQNHVCWKAHLVWCFFVACFMCHSSYLTEPLSCNSIPETLRKLDLLQPSGSFKLRGIGLTVKEAQQKNRWFPDLKRGNIWTNYSDLTGVLGPEMVV